MTRAAGIGFLIITAVLTAAPEASAAWELSPSGLGPVRIGMTRAQVEAAADDALVAVGECTAFVDGPQKVTLSFERGRLRYIAVFNRSIRTTRAIRVGSAVSALKGAYGSRLRRMRFVNDQV